MPYGKRAEDQRVAGHGNGVAVDHNGGWQNRSRSAESGSPRDDNAPTPFAAEGVAIGPDASGVSAVPLRTQALGRAW